MTPAELRIRERLLSLAEEAYRAFQCSLIPNVEPSRILGVRMPALRAYVKELKKTADGAVFLRSPNHFYLEEMTIHGLLLAEIRDVGALEGALDAFLPFVDNWATADLLSLKFLKKYPEKRMAMAKKYLSSSHPYTVRVGLGILMRHELDESFSPDVLSLAASVRSEEYYVNMMQAWFFATALAKQHEAALPYLTEERLSSWVHNKTIRKTIESDRITDAQKDFLRKLARKP